MEPAGPYRYRVSRSRWWLVAERLGLVQDRAGRARFGSRRWWAQVAFFAVWMGLIMFVFLPVLHRWVR